MSEDPSWDEYFIPGTQVLRNKFTGGGELPYGVDSERALRALEEHWASLRLIELQDNPILGLFDYDHMKAIHRHIFQDVYEWAGVERTTPMLGPLVKYGPDVSRFPDYDPTDRSVAHEYYRAGPELRRAAEREYDAIRHADYLRGLDVDDFVDALAQRWAAINQIHSFREGNTRGQFVFFSELAHHAGYYVDADAFAPVSQAQILAGVTNPLRDGLVAARFYYQDRHDAGPMAEVLSYAVRPLTEAEKQHRPIVPVEARRAHAVTSAAFPAGVIPPGRAHVPRADELSARPYTPTQYDGYTR